MKTTKTVFISLAVGLLAITPIVNLITNTSQVHAVTTQQAT